MVMKQKSMTIAETLITLGIIGVVAALTLGIIKQQQSKEVYSKLLKAQSTLQNAINLMAQEYGCVGDMQCTGLFATGNTVDDAIYALNGITTAELNAGLRPKGIAQYLNIAKNCGKGTGCFPNVTYQTLGGKKDTPWLNIDNNTTFYAKIMIQDGTSLMYAQYLGDNCTRDEGNGPMNLICGYFYIDINGFNKPNMVGRDLFVFWLSKNGVVYPGGNSFLTTFGLPSYCNTSNSTDGNNGVACTAKVLDEGGINY